MKAPSALSNSVRPFTLLTLLYPLALIVISVGVFHRVVQYDFTNWDDRTEIPANVYLNPPALPGLVYYWTHGVMELYIPLTWTAWFVIACFSSQPPAPIDPAMFHGANLIVHVLNAILVWLILRRLSGHDLASCIGAMFFVVHPLQVETVTWISGLKDLLAGFFSLLTIWLYLFVATRGRRDSMAKYLYCLLIACLILGQLCKPSTIVTPLITFVLDVLLLKRDFKRAVRFSIPLLLCCLPLTVIARICQHPNSLHVSLLLKPLLAIQILSFYATKLIWPVQLVPVYALTPQRLLSGTMIHWHWLATGVAIVTAVLLRQKWPEFSVGLIVFIAGLFPMLGLVEFSYELQSAVADHYVYVSMLGVAIAITFGLARIQYIRWASISAIVGCALAIAAFAVMSFRQADRWRDSMALWEYNLQIVPDSWTAHLDLSGALIEKAMWSRGLDESYKSLNGIPAVQLPIVYQHIGHCLLELHEDEAAVTAYEKAVELQSDNDLSRTDLAIAYSRSGRHADAVKELKLLAEKHPNDARIRNTLQAEEAYIEIETP